MGPLDGVKVIELAGLGPAPHCCMLLSDLGAEVIQVGRAAEVGRETGLVPRRYDVVSRGRRCLALDLKQPEGRDALLRLCEGADILIEGFRPGVLERLGLGPDVLHDRNAQLVIGRMTGWGQTGPIAHSAGHDINYIGLSGALAAIGTPEAGPVPPLNLVGDYGGGSLYLAMGVLAAVISARGTGKGQVVDASMVEGSASLMAMFYGFLAAGAWDDGALGGNMLDGGAPYYGTYRTRDGHYIALGPLEPQFYAQLLAALGLEESGMAAQNDRSGWAANRDRIAREIARHDRAHWEERLSGTDVCFAPVLTMSEAPRHPQNVARESFPEVDGITQPGPAPRFSATPGRIQGPPRSVGADTEAILRDSGFSAAEIAELTRLGAARQA